MSMRCETVYMAMRVADNCDAGIADQLQTMLQECNPFVQMFKQVKEIVTTQDVNLCFMAKMVRPSHF